MDNAGEGMDTGDIIPSAARRGTFCSLIWNINQLLYVFFYCSIS